VQVFHDIGEHAGRYKGFAEFLNDNGIIVYANDHRGHGKTAADEQSLGRIEGDAFNKILEDELIIRDLIEENHGELPIIILGHGFGSFIAQEFIIEHGREIDKVILSGTAVMTGSDIKAALKLASMQKRMFGDDSNGKIIENLLFRNYNSRFKDTSKSRLAWLNSDPEEVKKQEEDPLCNVTYSVGFYYYLLEAISKLYIEERLEKIPKELPILLLAGEEDPMGGYGELVKRLSWIRQVMPKGIEIKEIFVQKN
jgi:alpha-beta hydrolase superfamily lysophospholipase